MLHLILPGYGDSGPAHWQSRWEAADPAFHRVRQADWKSPRRPLPFPSLVVASSDDPYAGIDFARSCARDWGSRLAEVGAHGHINSDSGLGDWPEGRALLAALIPAS